MQDNWIELSQLAEFMYNNYVYHFMLMTPFTVNYNCHYFIQFQSPKGDCFSYQVQPELGIAQMEVKYWSV